MVSLKSMICLCPFITLVLFWGCAGMKMHAPAVATISGLSDTFRLGQIVDLDKGEALAFEALIDRVAPKELVFVGEVHDNPEHHLIQIQILQALKERGGPLNIAMEFFESPHQGALDRYLGGDLTERDLLKEVDWERGWGFDYHFYRPLLQWAKQNHAEVLAINAPRRIVRKVARMGLQGLEADERAQIAEHIDLERAPHRDYLRKVYGEHVHKGLKDFDFFYQAQCVWEDTMAENISKHVEESRTRMVVFTGNGHIVNKFGVPDRTFRRTPVSMVTIMPYPLHKKETIEKGTADYVWLTPPYVHRRMMVHGMGGRTGPGKGAAR